MSKLRGFGGSKASSAAWVSSGSRRSLNQPAPPAKRRWFVLSTVGLLFGCGSRVDPGTDGSTHWLSCETDAECGGLRCVALRCQKVSEPPSRPAPEPDDASSSSAQQTGTGNGPKAIGETCIPTAEHQPEFSGFGRDVVVVEMTSQCSTGTCLVNHFLGRVTCLYGGAANDGGLPACETPDGQAVTVAVPAQLEDRSPESAVYCSCRCDGPDSEADYCTCGDGFECSPVMPLEVPGAPAVAGSYCVKRGTNYDRGDIHRPCDAETTSCGDASRYNAQTLGIELTEAQLSEAESFEYYAELGGDFSDPTACLPRTLPLTERDGETGVACRIFELVRGGSGCSSPARAAVEEPAVRLAREQLASLNVCASESECAEYNVCEVPQISNAESTCRTQEQITEDGWCYVSERQTLGNPDLTKACPDGSPGSKLRFGGAGVLESGAFSYLVCSGQR